MSLLIVLENPGNWNLQVPGARVVTAREYLTDAKLAEDRQAKVLNLCRTYSFQTLGYYVSLLAAARGHRPMPSVSTLQDLRMSPVVRIVSDEIDEQMQRSFKAERSDRVALRIYFGASPAGHDRLARALFNYLPAPMLVAEFARTRGGDWKLDRIRPIAASEIPDQERDFVSQQVTRHFSRGGSVPQPAPSARFDLAILHDPAEVDSPSNDKTLQAFARAGKALGIDVDVIGKDDFGRLGEYDALFIRATTAVEHFTYRFARRAEAMGLVVIDAPRAILQATNKVYQSELFSRHGIPTPRTRLLHKDNVAEAVAELSYPLVIKRPDSSFSQGVRKAADRTQLDALLEEFFRSSDLVVAQEFVPSDFDWRIGVLDRRFLFAARYWMAPGHWQIQKSGKGNWRRFGKVEPVAEAEVPPQALELGVKAASLLGDGLFGVDVKHVDDRFLVMEVNDNPNVEVGYEDRILGDEIYRRIMGSFLERLERRGRENGRAGG